MKEFNLKKSYLDGREFGRLIRGGYEDDLKRKREKEQADIDYKKQLTESAKEQIRISKRNSKYKKQSQMLTRVLNNDIFPRINELKNRNASQEDYDNVSDYLKTQYPDLVKGFGDGGLRFARKRNQVVGQFNTPVTTANLNQFVDQGSPVYNLMKAKIEKNNGTDYFKLDIGEDGKMDISSIEDNVFNAHIDKHGILDDLNQFDKNTKWDHGKARQLIEYLRPLQESLPSSDITITHKLDNGLFRTSDGRDVTREEAEGIMGNSTNNATQTDSPDEPESNFFTSAKAMIQRIVNAPNMVYANENK